MKKLLGMLVVLFALLLAVSAGAEDSCIHEEADLSYVDLGDQHQMVCNACGTTWSPAGHSVYCDAPDVCRDCGAARTDDMPFYHWSGREYFHDENKCWSKCVTCGYVFPARPHNSDCSNPTTCLDCGKTGLTILPENMWHGSKSIVGAPAQHWFACDICGYIYEYEQHFAFCNNPTVCYRCGETDVEDMAISHIEGTEYINGGEMCHEVCSGCLELVWETAHAIDCSGEATTCFRCGGVNVSGRTYHPYEFVMVNDGTRHHQECSGCGVVFWSQEHQVLCTAELPTICWVCHLEIGEDAQPVPQHIYVYENLGETHRATCEYCGKIVEAPHTASCINPTHCTECNADNVTVAEEQIQHDRDGSTTTHTEETHSFRCYDCDETITRPHEFDPNNLCQDCYYVNYTTLPGDADNDNKVTMNDAVAVLQKLANDSLYINEPNADVNADGTVDTEDMLLIMQYAAGWDVTLK